MNHRSTPARGLLATALFSFSAGLFAQSAPPTQPTTSGPNKQETVVLSPFAVTANPESYEPTESSTGARINVQLENLPFAVSTIDSNYLQDFQVHNLSDQLAFASSMSGLNDVGGFNLRGFGGNISLRNGYSRLGFFAEVEIQRVEFVKGPAAAVYGQTNPGGIVNFVTLTPTPTPTFYADQNVGGYDYQHSDLVYTSSNSGPVAVAIAGQYEHQHYISPRAAEADRDAYMDLVWNINKTTSLSFDGDWDYESFTGGSSGVGLPYVVNVNAPTTAINRYTGIAWGLIHKYYIDASQWNHRTSFQYEAIFQSKLTDFLDMKLGGGIYEDPRFSYSDGLSNSYDPTTGNLIGDGGRPNYNLLQGDGRMGSLDLVAHYDWPGQGEQQTLFTTDYYDNIGRRPLWEAPAGTLPTTYNVFAGSADPQLPLIRDPNVSSTAAFAGTGIVPFQAISNSGGIMEDDFAETTGFSLRQYANFLDSHLIVALGLRFDHVQLFKEFLGAADGNLNREETQYSQAPTKWTKQMAVAWKFNPNLMVYVNRTESFVPNSPSATAATGLSTVFPPQSGLGYEVGVKADFPNNPQLSFTSDVYWIKLDNVIVNVPNPANLSQTVAEGSGTQYSKGVEFDGNWQITPQLALLGGASAGDFYYGYQGSNTALVGEQTSGVPRFQGTASVAYHPTNALLLTVDGRAFSSFRVNNSDATGPNGTTINDGRLNIRGPGYALFDCGAQYTLPVKSGFKQTLGVSVENLLNRTYVIVGSVVPGNGTAVYGMYKISY